MGDGYGKEFFVFLFFLIFLLLGDGYGRWLRGVFVFLFSSYFTLRAMVTGSMVTGSLWVMVTGDGYGKSLFSFFFLIFPLSGGWLREMVTGDGYGESLFSFFS